MARRYSGKLVIVVNYSDLQRSYVGRIVCPEMKGRDGIAADGVLYHFNVSAVKVPSLEVACSPEAFDDVAREVLTLAAADDIPVDAFCAWKHGLTGRSITRRKWSEK